jgi:CIC family chloride channel protein
MVFVRLLRDPHDRHYEVEVLHIVVVPRHQSLSEVSVKTSMGQSLLSSAIGLGQIWQVPVHTQIRLAHDQSEAILEIIRTYHINLTLMDWKVSRKPRGNRFNRIVDKVIRHADCDVMLVKVSLQNQFERFLIPVGAEFNAKKAIKFLPSLITLGHKPMITFCQVFDINQKEPHPMALKDLDKTAHLAQKHFNVEIVTVPIDKGSTGTSITKAILEYAQQDYSDVIVLEASRAGILHHIMQGNIPADISYYSNQTVILLRGG